MYLNSPNSINISRKKCKSHPNQLYYFFHQHFSNVESNRIQNHTLRTHEHTVFTLYIHMNNKPLTLKNNTIESTREKKISFQLAIVKRELMGLFLPSGTFNFDVVRSNEFMTTYF